MIQEHWPESTGKAVLQITWTQAGKGFQGQDEQPELGLEMNGQLGQSLKLQESPGHLRPLNWRWLASQVELPHSCGDTLQNWTSKSMPHLEEEVVRALSPQRLRAWLILAVLLVHLKVFPLQGKRGIQEISPTHILKCELMSQRKRRCVCTKSGRTESTAGDMQEPSSLTPEHVQRAVLNHTADLWFNRGKGCPLTLNAFMTTPMHKSGLTSFEQSRPHPTFPQSIQYVRFRVPFAPC